MAVTVIITATLSIIATVMAVLALMPVIQDMGTDQGGNWDDTLETRDADCSLKPVDEQPACEERQVNAQRAVESRDRTFSAIVVLPVFLIGAIAAWAFLAVTRRDYGET